MVKSTQKKISIVLAVAMILTMFTFITGISSVSASAAQNDKIYFQKPTSWSGTPSCYAWGGTSGANAGWPGAAMTAVSGDVYSYTVPGDQVNVIFTNGNYQTADLKLEGTNKIFKITSNETGKNANGAWEAYGNVDPTDPSTGTEPTTATSPIPSGTGATAVLKNAANWSNASIYYWNGSKENAAWPGVALTDNDKDSNGNYVVDIPAEYIGATDAGVIFNNGGSSQSDNLKIAGGDCKIYDNSSKSWTDYDTNLVKLSLSTSQESPQYKDTDITFTAEASGGSGSYSYKFYVNDLKVQDSSTNTYTWSPATAGTYTIKVEVLDTDGNTNSKTKVYEIKDDALAVDPVLKGITTTSGSNTQVVKGQSTDVKVRASGGNIGTNLLFYKIAIYDPNGTAVNTVYYKTGNSLNFTPTMNGDYKVEVSVQNSNNTTKTGSYTLTSSGNIVTVPSVTSFSANVASPQYTGTDVTLTAAATGGTAPYQYQFIANGQVVQDYSSSNTCVWKPQTAGSYTLSVTVKDSANQISDAKTMPYTISTQSFILGDANGDGVVNVKDVIFIQRILAHQVGYDLNDLTDAQKSGADMNADGVINIKDVILLQKQLAHIV